MAKITNNSRETLNFITGVKDGNAITESLKAGETRAIDVHPSDAQVNGRRLAGLITIEGWEAPVARRFKEAGPASERRTAQTLGGDAPVRD